MYKCYFNYDTELTYSVFNKILNGYLWSCKIWKVDGVHVYKRGVGNTKYQAYRNALK